MERRRLHDHWRLLEWALLKGKGGKRERRREGRGKGRYGQGRKGMGGER